MEELISKDVFLTLLGAFVGFMLSILLQFFNTLIKNIRYKNHFVKFCGTYLAEKKDKSHTKIISINIDHSNNNVLKVSFEIENNDNAEGNLVMDESTLMYGTLFYHHLQPENRHRSGIYDVMFIDKNEIHARQSYINQENNQEILCHYIWKRKV